MYDRTFQPAGAAIAAIVAGLAPTAIAAAQADAPAQEKSARETLQEAAAKMAPVAPFSARQLDLPFDD